MIDFHSHVLPGVDDGSPDVETSLAMLRKEAEQGVKTVVATPHFYADEDSPDAFLTRRQEALQKLQEAAEPGLPEILPGAEVAFFRGMSHCEAMWDLRIADTSCILIEMPEMPWAPQVMDEIEKLANRLNLTPILAHIDRYLPRIGTRKFLDRLLELPVLLQVNTSFFLDKKVGKKALRLLQDGLFHFIGTDCHNLQDRQPDMGKVLEKLDENDIAHIRYHQQQVLSENEM